MKKVVFLDVLSVFMRNTLKLLCFFVVSEQGVIFLLLYVFQMDLGNFCAYIYCGFGTFEQNNGGFYSKSEPPTKLRLL